MELTESSFSFACRQIIQSGTVIFLPTVITSSIETYDRVLPIIAKVITTEEFHPHVPGIHLEGPFISVEDGARGCHVRDHVTPPDIHLLEHLQKIADGKISLLTVAAELEGTAELVAYANAQGIRVSLGHQMADSEQISAVCREGAVMLTHLGNGLSSPLHRHCNPLIAGLAEPRLTAAIITDGHHLPIPLIKVILNTKGLNKTIITSDMCPVTGMENGEYDYNGRMAVLHENGSFRLKQSNTLAGSARTLLQCANFLLSNGICSVRDVERLCFYNPLEILGIDHGVVKLRTKRTIHLNDQFLLAT